LALAPVSAWAQSFAYVANSTDGKVSAHSINSVGALTAVAGSPFASGSFDDF